MAFTSVEIIALVVMILAVVKMLILSIKPMAWINLPKKFSGKIASLKIIGVVLALVLFYYLTQAGITVIQILAISAFVFSLLIVGLAPNLDVLVKKYSAQAKKGNMFKDHWIYVLLWVILLLLGVNELLM